MRTEDNIWSPTRVDRTECQTLHGLVPKIHEVPGGNVIHSIMVFPITVSENTPSFQDIQHLHYSHLLIGKQYLWFSLKIVLKHCVSSAFYFSLSLNWYPIATLPSSDNSPFVLENLHQLFKNLCVVFRCFKLPSVWHIWFSTLEPGPHCHKNTFLIGFIILF